MDYADSFLLLLTILFQAALCIINKRIISIDERVKFFLNNRLLYIYIYITIIIIAVITFLQSLSSNLLF